MSITRTALTLLLLLFYSGSVFAQPFTYQGFLKEGGLPANGTYDLTFRLFTELSGGHQVGNTITLNNQSVQNGLFTGFFWRRAATWASAQPILPPDWR